jgi:hypothetical protein
MWSEQLKHQFTVNRVALHLPQSNIAESSAAQQYEGMIAAFLDRGARVCLVSMPVSPIYRDIAAALPDADKERWEAAHAYFRILSEQENVRYLDHRDLYADLSLFRDPDHLNKSGAMRYGPVLQEACFGDGLAPDVTTIAEL